MKKILATACVIVFGVVWAAVVPAMAQSTTEKAKDKTESTGEKVKDKAKDTGETIKDKTKSAGEKIKEKAEEVKDKITGKAKKSERAAASSGDVRAAQQALADKGYNPGPVDGVMGPKTQAAVKDFQKKEGLKATGRLDNETTAKLGVEGKAGASATSGGSATSASPSTTTDTAAPAPKTQKP